MSDKLKVYNAQKFDIGVVTQDRPMGMNVKTGSFIMLTRDEIDYLMSVSSLFQRGFLRVAADKEQEILNEVGIDVNTDTNFVDEEDIRKKLSGTAKNLEAWLATIHEDVVLDRIFDVAMGMNLNMSKIKVLQKKMPTKEFLNED